MGGGEIKSVRFIAKCGCNDRERKACYQLVTQFDLENHPFPWFISLRMNWHYEHAGQALGPVTEEQIQVMRARGIIGQQDRVWRQDWPVWRHVGEVWPLVGATAFDPSQSQVQPLAMPPPGSACEECGAKDSLLFVGGLPVCRSCAPYAQEKVNHGIPLGIGPWRDGRQIVVRMGEREVSLPPHCVKCAAASETELKKRLFWHPPIIYLAIFAGGLPYVLLALWLRKTLTIRLPLCHACARTRWRNIAISLLSLSVSLALLAAGFLWRSHPTLGISLAVAGGVLFFFFLSWAITIQIVVPRKIDERYAWLDKVGQPWLMTLPPWPYR